MWYVLNESGRIMARGVDSCAPTDDELTAMKKAFQKQLTREKTA